MGKGQRAISKGQWAKTAYDGTGTTFLTPHHLLLTTHLSSGFELYWVSDFRFCISFGSCYLLFGPFLPPLTAILSRLAIFPHLMLPYNLCRRLLRPAGKFYPAHLLPQTRRLHWFCWCRVLFSHNLLHPFQAIP